MLFSNETITKIATKILTIGIFPNKFYNQIL